VNRIIHPFDYLFGHIHLGLFLQICGQSMVWRGFVICLRFGSCFHNFYESKVSHNIEGDVCLIKRNCPFFVQILFFGWIESFGKWNLLKGLNVVICGSIKTFCLVCMGGEISNPFHLKCQSKFSFHLRIWHFHGHIFCSSIWDMG
jgi:hypothetical protein